MNQNNFDVVNRLATSAALQGKIAVERLAFSLSFSRLYYLSASSSISLLFSVLLLLWLVLNPMSEPTFFSIFHFLEVLMFNTCI